MKSWFKSLAIALGKFVLKIGVVVLIGAIISFAIYYIKGYSLGATMRIVGIVIVFIGLLSQLGQNNIRGDYNYSMARMRDSKMLDNEYNGHLTSDSLSFLIWMGFSGIVLFVIGSALV